MANIEYRVRQSVRHLITRFEKESGVSTVVCELADWEKAIDLAKKLASTEFGAIYHDGSTSNIVVDDEKKTKVLQKATKPFMVRAASEELIYNCLRIYESHNSYELKITKTVKIGTLWYVNFLLSYTAKGANNTDLVRSVKAQFKSFADANDGSYVDYHDKCKTVKLSGKPKETSTPTNIEDLITM